VERVELAGAYHRAARARQLGVPQIEITALEHLDAHGALTPGELGHRLGLTSGGVTALTGRMIDAGHVTRERHPGDGRMRMLTVTPAGADRLREHLEPVRDAVTGAVAGLRHDEAELVARVLDAVAERSEAAAAATPGPERLFPADGYSRALLM
jgi:DNA-binding MarR family transcriptional regulator